MNEVNQPDGPVYALAQREAVERVNGDLIVLDSQLLLTGKIPDESGTITDELGVLLFTRQEFAERCRAKIQKLDSVIATFRGSEHLAECLLDFLNRGCRAVVMNRNSGVGRESIVP